MICVTTPSYSLKVNGETFGFFKGRRGLRQGDPISPFLYVVGMEYLSRKLNRVDLHRDFNYHPQCQALSITHLAFADDLMAFTRGDLMSVQLMYEALDAFGLVSGLQANSAKSDIYLAGVDEVERTLIMECTGFTGERIPFCYLGIPLSGTSLKVAEYEPLMEKVSKTILSWSSLNPSYAGRIEVIKSVVQGIQCFWIGVLLIPSMVLDRITSLCRRFLWVGNSARVAWNIICLRKDQGGLGFRDIRRWNDALLAKVLRNLHNNKESLWCRWIHHVYLKRGSVLDLQG